MFQVLIHKIRLLLTCVVLFGCSNGTNLLGGFNSRQSVESQTSNVSSENSTQQQQGVTQSTDLGDGRVVSDATDLGDGRTLYLVCMKLDAYPGDVCFYGDTENSRTSQKVAKSDWQVYDQSGQAVSFSLLDAQGSSIVIPRQGRSDQITVDLNMILEDNSERVLRSREEIFIERGQFSESLLPDIIKDYLDHQSQQKDSDQVQTPSETDQKSDAPGTESEGASGSGHGHAVGVFDTSFGGTGFVSLEEKTTDESGFGIELQSDGKLLVAGRSSFHMRIWRYLQDGQPDLSFGHQGVFTHEGSQGAEVSGAMDLKVLQNQDIVGAGCSGNNIIVFKLDQSGQLNREFGSDGITVINLSANDCAKSIAISPDGAILLTGYTYKNGSRDMVLIKLDSSGNLDRSFGDDGIVVSDGAAGAAGQNDQGIQVLVHTDGKILVAGHSVHEGDSDPLSNDVVLWRFLSNGTLDTSLDGDGIYSKDFAAGQGDGPDDDRAFGVAIQRDGRIIVGAQSFGSNEFAKRLVLIGLQDNGQPDLNFGVGGVTFHDINGNDLGKSLTLADNDMILIGGYSGNSADNDMIVWRFFKKGVIDPNFASSGVFRHSSNVAGGSGGDNFAEDIVISPSGEIFTTGTSDSPESKDLSIWKIK